MTGLGIIGCGDFLRWMEPDLLKSEVTKVVALTDLDQGRAESYAAKLGGEVLENADRLIEHPAVDVVCLFVPPWLRKDLVVQVADAGKHIIATKPIASSVADCDAIAAAVKDNVRCGVFYGRTGDSSVEALKRLFDSGEIGRLALYKREWLHHYPQWNSWAIDPEKNGGPFMDAMIHNLNAARYLMGRPLAAYTFFSDNLAHPELPCADTDLMKVDFAERGAAYLAISWAADLEVYSTDGNYREHIDLYYMITDQGWYVTLTENDDETQIRASKRGEVKTWAVAPLAVTPFDRFVEAVSHNEPFDGDIVDVVMACEDIGLLRRAENHIGECLIWQ